jgi:hypothetical protein
MLVDPLHTAGRSFSPNGKELSRLVSAAVVSREFCDLLLEDAATALRIGYNGSGPFHLTPDNQQLVLSIRATSLADFAAQLTESGRNEASSVVETESQEPLTEV